MKTNWVCLFAAVGLSAAPPAITDLQPRGAQKGRPFTLTLVGKELAEGGKVWSTMPATFTPMAPEKTGPMTEGRYATFLVEPKPELGVGVYPIRVITSNGISNIQLFTVGAFPEFAEEESKPGALPNSNDSIENAQSLPAAAATINGTLRGPDRDIYRVQVKAGERRVFEVEARRSGSAIDPVLRVSDQSGKVIAKSEDSPLVGLDARLEVTFPRDGYYYVEVHDARYSAQTYNFYRLKTGAYNFPHEVFPLGGRRGENVEVQMGTQKLTADLRTVPAREKRTWINLPDSPTLPLPFAVGDDPELTEPLTRTVTIPATINARLATPAEKDRYEFLVSPGDTVTFRIEARELGTSKLMAVLAAFDESGKQIARSGDEPLGEDPYTVGQSRTAGDPFLRVEVPAGVKTLTLTVEDLALRGGPGYAYRLNARRQGVDFRLTLNAPFVNIPAGGSVAVPVAVERRGFDSEIQLRVANAPKGLKVEGGFVVAGAPIKERPQTRNSRGILVLSADPGVILPPMELTIEGAGRLDDGTQLVRKAEGLGLNVGVSGATLQGSVDRQKPITAPWLALELPAAGTKAPAATLEVKMLSRKRMAEGDELKFGWKWTLRDPMQPLPRAVSAEMVGAGDVRVIDAKADPKDKTSGTFLMTTTKLTRPSRYDLYVTGRLMIDGAQEDIISRPITVEIEEVKSSDAAPSTGSER
ncbi:MAG: PPC domain-containing protein [Acidobacteria bacterium]|nr:PPC domain-containing protein [Acidobacteriota bacterium]